jgi:hypothetical protein
MNVKNISVVLATALLCACSGGGGGPADNTQGGNNNNGGATTGAIVDNEDKTAGLQGVDGNANGIRDDVDRLIALKYSTTPVLKKAADQKAKALQKALTVTTADQARLWGNEIMRASACVELATTDESIRSQLSKEVEALTANTQERFTAYWSANELAGGMVFTQPTSLYCD